MSTDNLTPEFSQSVTNDNYIIQNDFDSVESKKDPISNSRVG